jgi:TRAP transporter TAXI family solute receptor
MKNNSGTIPDFAWPVFLLLAIVALLLLSVSEPSTKVEAPLPPQLYSSSYQLLGTGNKLGTYYPAGHILTKWFNSNSGVDAFKAVETNGSVDNIRLLKEKKISFAFVESRIVQKEFSSDPSSSLRLVWPLWPDLVQLLRSPVASNTAVPDLTFGFLGQKNSSTYNTSAQIFSAFGKNIEEMAAEIGPDKVLSRLASGKIEFAMIQAGIPNRTVSDAVIFHGCTLAPFSAKQLDSLNDKLPTSSLYTISQGYYGESQPQYTTIAIPNVLVTTSDAGEETIEIIAELLSFASSALRIRHEALAEIPSDPWMAQQILAEIKVPVHPGTLNYINKARGALAKDNQ